jgi:hypothetical protein
MVLCSASCLPLRFSQPERLSQRKGNRPPCPLRRHPFYSVMADRVTIISPRDPWPFSTVTAGDLEDLVAEGLLRPLSDERQPEWIPPVSEAAPSPPSGYIVSFVSFHERGFGVPASRFMRAILRGVLRDRPPLGLVDSSLFRGAFRFADGGEKGPCGSAGRRLHPLAEAVAGVAVYPCHPCVFEQGVAAPVVLPPE